MKALISVVRKVVGIAVVLGTIALTTQPSAAQGMYGMYGMPGMYGMRGMQGMQGMQGMYGMPGMYGMRGMYGMAQNRWAPPRK